MHPFVGDKNFSVINMHGTTIKTTAWCYPMYLLAFKIAIFQEATHSFYYRP